MTTFLEIALVNAVLVAILAGVVFAITRIWKNPHLAHVLWLVVLLKIVTPPLVRVPISFGFEWSTGEIASTATEELYTSELASTSATEKTGDLSFESVKASALLINPPIERPFEPAMRSMEHEISAKPIKAMKTRVLWPFYVGVVWLSGSLLYAFIAGVRTVRFHRRLKEADLACKTLQRMGKAVAREFGLKQCPVLRVTDGHLSPMVWPVSHPPTVVLPLGLVENLQNEQLRTIVAHEYGHIVRRDHWVRWLEIVSTTLYWWHPCLWLVRKEIRMAEELCCDALVVKTYPGSSQVFGESLLKVSDFLSGIPQWSSNTRERNTRYRSNEKENRDDVKRQKS